MLGTMSPRATVGNGNCAYRAVALALFRDQCHHSFVRFKAATEIIEHRSYYNHHSADFVVTDNRMPTASFDKLLSDVLINGDYAEITHLYAISAAFESTIQSYMPPTSAISGGSNPYTCVIASRHLRTSMAPVCTLMWTSLSVPPGW